MQGKDKKQQTTVQYTTTATDNVSIQLVTYSARQTFRNRD